MQEAQPKSSTDGNRTEGGDQSIKLRNKEPAGQTRNSGEAGAIVAKQVPKSERLKCAEIPFDCQPPETIIGSADNAQALRRLMKACEQFRECYRGFTERHTNILIVSSAHMNSAIQRAEAEMDIVNAGQIFG